ncbi:MAG: hypothetical protein ABR936_17270 [Bacteroidota bacterium]|jgi:hypothetical protein
MKIYLTIAQILLLITTFTLYGQNPDKQISFALEHKPHSYYVKQAVLWWKEIKKDTKNENAWYNYFRACRNAQATVGWNKDYIKESPYLKSGPDIVKLIQKNVPNTFTSNFVIWEERGFDPTKGEYLLKAYDMNPDFEGIHASMIAYAESELNYELRKKVNIKWFPHNEISPGLLAYGYNVLMSLEPNSIILTEHDNDTFPLLMLQDVKNIRPDVTVINFDMLLVKSYRDKIFHKYQIAQLDTIFEETSSINHEILINHILKNYSNAIPLYFGLTVTPTYYGKYLNNLFVTGLALRYSHLPIDTFSICEQHYDNDFKLDYLGIQYSNDRNQSTVNQQNKNYLPSIIILYHSYKIKDTNKAIKLKKLAILIAENSGDSALMNKVNEELK